MSERRVDSRMQVLSRNRICSTVFHPRWNAALRTPLPKCGTVHMGCVPVTVAIPNEVRGA
jgi:hypothetical protein